MSRTITNARARPDGTVEFIYEEPLSKGRKQLKSVYVLAHELDGKSAEEIVALVEARRQTLRAARRTRGKELTPDTKDGTDAQR